MDKIEDKMVGMKSCSGGRFMVNCNGVKWTGEPSPCPGTDGRTGRRNRGI